MQFKRWFRITALLALIAGTAAVATGATIERAVRARLERESRVPGRLVDVGGGRRIQLDCRGAGAPTVVLESGLDNYGSLAWSAVHDSVARTTRACAYSRAGIMWSDDARGRFDSRLAANDLRAALALSGESAPWVMVGHSIGAAYVTTFTQRFPAEVRGLVLVDGSHPDQFAHFLRATGKSLAPSATVPRVGAALSWTGLLRALPSEPSPAAWPSVVDETAPAFLPTSLAALAEEAAAIPATLSRAAAHHALGDRPLIVLTAMVPTAPADLAMMGLTVEQGKLLRMIARTLHDEQARWSTRGRHDTVPGASHYIQFDRPEVVVGAVREVVAAVRAGFSR